MGYQVSYEARSRYLLVRVSGQYDATAAREALKVVREKATHGGFRHVLIDAMGVSAPATELDRYMMGEAFADILPSPFRVAVLYKTPIDKFMENTAAIRGATLLICSQEAEALQWLIESPPGHAWKDAKETSGAKEKRPTRQDP